MSIAAVSDASASVMSYNSTNTSHKHHHQHDHTDDELQITPSTLQVDYDTDGCTELYKAITQEDWKTAVAVCKQDPSQAATWVVRHYESGEEDEAGGGDSNHAVMWRFLPLHSACARQPPTDVVRYLLQAYSDAAACVDDQGMWALHYATGNRASASVVRLLLQHCRVAALQRDPRGMLPIHYLANWGPASMEVLELLLDSKTMSARDADGNTPLDLALSAEYELRDQVVHRLQIATKSKTPLLLSSLAGKASPKLTWRRAMFDDASTTSTSSVASFPKQQQPQPKPQQRPPRSTSSSSSTAYSVGSTSSTVAISSVHKESRHDDDHEDVDHHQNRTGRGVSSPSEGGGGGGAAAAGRHHRRRHSSSRSEFRESSDPPVSDDTVSVASLAPRPDVNAELKTVMEKKGPESNYKTHQEEKTMDIPVVMEDYDEEVTKHEESSSSGSTTIRFLQEQLQQANASLRQKDQDLEQIQQLYHSAAQLAAKHEVEANGLRNTLGNLMEQHELLQRKYNENRGRLESLTFSVESIMEQQRVVKEEVDSILEREAARDELLERCLDLKQPSDSKTYIGASMEKQGRELEAVIAVIKAAKE